MKSLALALVCLTGCATLKELAADAGIKAPEVKYDKTTFKAADFEALHCDIAFAVTNPNRVGGHLSGYAMKMVVDGLTIADGTVDEPLDLGAGQTTTFVIPATVKWAEIAKRLQQPGGVPNDLPWHLEGSAKVKVADQDIALPFAVDGTLPVLRPPTITPVALHVMSASMTNVKLGVDLEMKTNGGHPLAIGELLHQIDISGQTVMSGKLAPPGNVPGTSIRTLTADVSPLSAGVALISALQGSKPVDVHFNGQTTVDTGFGIVPFKVDTTTKLAAAR
jgi:hypothetical protein